MSADLGDETHQLLKYTEIGVASVVCGVVGFVCLVLMFLLGVEVVLYLVPVLGVLAVVFGAYAFWGMKRDSLGWAGFALGMCLIILWFLYYAYISATGMLRGFY